MKYLKICVEINAYGAVSAKVYDLPVTDFYDGRTVAVAALFPPHIIDYVAPIFAKLSDDGAAIDIISEKYGNGRLPLNGEYGRWYSPEIGLSYAKCEVSARIEEQD